jgi:hypothetical protein
MVSPTSDVGATVDEAVSSDNISGIEGLKVVLQSLKIIQNACEAAMYTQPIWWYQRLVRL